MESERVGSRATPRDTPLTPSLTRPPIQCESTMTLNSLLQSLNMQGCPRVHDEGLIALGKGCRALQFVNLRECGEVTDEGIAGLAKGCRSLAVLNLYSCVQIGNKALKALGKHCPMLKSLNVARCVGVTDPGVAAVGEGCRHLQSLNLAGCMKVSERGVCFVAFHCKGLQYLNVSGCEEITTRGLSELLSGLPYVQMAKSFMGFNPKPDAVQLKVRGWHMCARSLGSTAVARGRGGGRGCPQPHCDADTRSHRAPALSPAARPAAND